VENVEKQVCQKKMNKPEKRVLTIWMRDGNLTKLSDRTPDELKKIFKKDEKNS
jgi:hypothetical protein